MLLCFNSIINNVFQSLLLIFLAFKDGFTPYVASEFISHEKKNEELEWSFSQAVSLGENISYFLIIMTVLVVYF